MVRAQARVESLAAVFNSTESLALRFGDINPGSTLRPWEMNHNLSCSCTPEIVPGHCFANSALHRAKFAPP